MLKNIIKNIRSKQHIFGALSLTALMVLVAFSSMLVIIPKVKADPGPYDDWEYYKVCNIEDPIANYQMVINVSKTSGGNVSCEGRCQDDFDDIRFLDIDNSTELAYFRESYVSGQYAYFWVNVSSDIVTDGTILLLYGNDTALTTSNGTNTWLDFTDYTISNKASLWTKEESANRCSWWKNASSVDNKRERIKFRVNDTVTIAIYADAIFVTITDYKNYDDLGNQTGIVWSDNAAVGATNTSPGIKSIWYNGTGADSNPYAAGLCNETYTKYIDFAYHKATITKCILYNSSYAVAYSIENDTNDGIPLASLSYLHITILGTGAEATLTDAGSYGLHLHGERGNGVIDVNIYWWAEGKYNATEPSWSSFGSEQSHQPNISPVFSSPNPANKSTDVSVSTTTWNVTIEAPNGDTFNWTIELSNENSSSGNDATNGSKVCNINVTYATNYTVWVNATDGNHTTNETFWFVTEEGTPTFTIKGLPNDIITFSGTSGTSVYCNSSGDTNEWLEYNMSLNATVNVTELRVYMDDLNDTSAYINASNITMYVANASNATYYSFGTFADGGSNISINRTTWNTNIVIDNPFNGTGLTNINTSIYIIFKLVIPAVTPTDIFWASSSTACRIVPGHFV